MLKIYENHDFIMISSVILVNQLMSLICTMRTLAVLCEFLMDFQTLHEHYIWKPE